MVVIQPFKPVSKESNMEDKLNTLLDRLVGAFDKWLTDFESHP